MNKIFFTALTLILTLSSAPYVHAATTQINYSMSDSAVFVAASGTAAVTINYTVLGVTLTQLITGTASGATSWNITGGIGVTITDAEALSTQPNLAASRRAGTIHINFPLFDLGGFASVDFDTTVKSRDSSMALDGEAPSKVNSTDWAVGQDYSAHEGLVIDTNLGFNLSSPIVSNAPFPMLLSLSNQGGGGSLAEFVSLSLSSSGTSLEPDGEGVGCYNLLFQRCLARINSVNFDFSGVRLDYTVAGGSSSSSTPLPSAVPIPAAAFMFAPALLGFMGLRRRAKNKAL